MTYVLSQPHKCPKCGFECKAGGSDMDYWKYSPITENRNPICPKCWNEFLDSLGAEMLCTIDWDGSGSEFSKKAKAGNDE